MTKITFDLPDNYLEFLESQIDEILRSKTAVLLSILKERKEKSYK